MTGALLAIATAIVVTLAIPVGVEFDLGSRPETRRRILLILAFGLVRFDLAQSSDDTSLREATEDDGEGNRRSLNGKDGTAAAPRWLGVFARRALSKRKLRNVLFKFCRSSWRLVRKKDVVVDITLGTGDPADTGRLWAFAGPLSASLQRSDNIEFRLRPDFLDPRFEAHCSGICSVVPLHVLLHVLRYAASPTIWNELRISRRLAAA